jgi:Fic family protein
MECKNRISYEDVKRLSQTKALLGYSEREQKEILNHLKAYEFVKTFAREQKQFTEEVMKDIHEILVEGILQGGVYRNVNINIFGASHQPPDYVKVYDRMAKFFRHLDDFVGTDLEKATYAHASIAKIHPFVDGNARLAKLVLNYYLIKNDYLPISIPMEQREIYFEKLEKFKSEKEIEPLASFFKELLVKRYEEVLKELDL